MWTVKFQSGQVNPKFYLPRLTTKECESVCSTMTGVRLTIQETLTTVILFDIILPSFLHWQIIKISIDLLWGDSDSENSWQGGDSDRQTFSPSEFLESTWGGGVRFHIDTCIRSCLFISKMINQCSVKWHDPACFLYSIGKGAISHMQITWPWPPVGIFSHDLITIRQKKMWT